MEYYIHKDDAQQGPFTLGQLRTMWASGSITADTLYWVEGAPDWSPLRAIITRLEQQQSSPAATPKREYPAPAIPGAQPARRVIAGTSTAVVIRPAKSRGVFIILGLFLGLLGIHNFYAGYYRRGVWQIVLTVLLCWTIVVPIGVAIWVIIELCTVTDDADNHPLV
jgi:TM2 domain-containing membrane protein YozV